MSQYTNGYAEGMLLKTEKGPERTIITLIPSDIDFKKLKSIKPQKVVVENDKIITFPKGTWSNDLSKMWLLPPTARDLPNELKNTPLGKQIMIQIEDICIYFLHLVKYF